MSETTTAQQAQSARGLLLAVGFPFPFLAIGAASPRRRRYWAALALTVVTLAGCGGDSSGSSTAPGQTSQPKTYSVTVMASGSAIPSHSAEFMLTVTD